MRKQGRRVSFSLRSFAPLRLRPFIICPFPYPSPSSPSQSLLTAMNSSYLMA